MNITEIMEKVDQLKAEGYKMAASGREDGRIETGSISPYTGEYGIGYIVKASIGYPAGYYDYEIYTKGGAN
jgi:hypothetical protein